VTGYAWTNAYRDCETLGSNGSFGQVALLLYLCTFPFMARQDSLSCPLPDGAALAYDIFGLEQLGKGRRLPLVLIGGKSSIKIDWDRLVPSLSQKRTSMSGCPSIAVALPLTVVSSRI
jgi:hypothetical protein